MGLNAAVTRAALDPHRPQVDVLEAGYGSASHPDFGSTARITGIDISASQLERTNSLDVRITCDLQVIRCRVRTFDVVVCWNVLEHLVCPPGMHSTAWQ